MLMTSVYTLINIPLLVRLLFITQLENVDFRISLPLAKTETHGLPKKTRQGLLVLSFGQK